MPSLAASLANLEIARVRQRPWRPWRSPRESYVIQHLVWQWFIYRGRKCSARALARQIGVHHQYVQKLVQKFKVDSAKMLREERESGFEMATFEQLRVAREQTRWMAERNLLRPLRRSKWGDRKMIWLPLRIQRQIPMWATPGYSMMCANGWRGD